MSDRPTPTEGSKRFQHRDGNLEFHPFREIDRLEQLQYPLVIHGPDHFLWFCRNFYLRCFEVSSSSLSNRAS